MTNNDIFKKVRLIVHKLSGANDNQMMEAMSKSGFDATKDQFANWKRSKTHERYRDMSSRALNAFIDGLEQFAFDYSDNQPQAKQSDLDLEETSKKRRGRPRKEELN